MKKIAQTFSIQFILIFIFIAGCAWQARAETFFVYVAEGDGTDNPDTSSAVREGLLAGLFELGHIVFDDLPSVPAVDWINPDFKPAIRTALTGGARYLLAIRPLMKSRPAPAGQTKTEQLASYYFFKVENGLLMKEGELVKTYLETAKGFNPFQTGFRFGNELSLLINGIWEEIDKFGQ